MKNLYSIELHKSEHIETIPLYVATSSIIYADKNVSTFKEKKPNMEFKFKEGGRI